MKIIIKFNLETDGDFSLRNPEQFGTYLIDFEQYSGEKIFEDTDVWRCKYNAKCFLENFICDGIHISSSHFYLLKEFVDVVIELESFINNADYGYFTKEIFGNYEGTEISVEIVKE